MAAHPTATEYYLRAYKGSTHYVTLKGPRAVQVSVDSDGEVRAWDEEAGDYSRHHDLTEEQENEARSLVLDRLMAADRAAAYFPGQKVTRSGYPGTVTKVEGSTVHVRLESGEVAVDADDLRPLTP